MGVKLVHFCIRSSRLKIYKTISFVVFVIISIRNNMLKSRYSFKSFKMKCISEILLFFCVLRIGSSAYHNRFKPVDAAIFDMDGLLLNTELIYFQSHSEVLARFNKTYPMNLKVKIMGTQPKYSSKLIVDTLGLNITPEEYRSEYEKIISERLYSVEFMPGAKKLLKHLSIHKIPMAVASSNTKEVYKMVSEHHKNMFLLFDHIVLGGSDPAVKWGKPAPDIFLICMDRFQEHFKAIQMIVFEDSPQGVLGAIRAGMQVVMVPDPVLPKKFSVNATQVLVTLLDFKPEEFGLPPFEPDLDDY